MPDEYDCAFRKAAYEYGIKLRPDRGSFRTLFEALQLQWCNMTTPSEMDHYTPPKYATPTTGTVVFVAPGGSEAAEDNEAQLGQLVHLLVDEVMGEEHAPLGDDVPADALVLPAPRLLAVGIQPEDFVGKA